MTCYGMRFWTVCSRRSINRAFSMSAKMGDKDKRSELDAPKAFKDFKGKIEMGHMNQLEDQIKFEDPIRRTLKIVKNDMRLLGHKAKTFLGFDAELHHDVQAQFFPTHTDVVIIGGGAIGSSVAYWLKQRAPNAMNIVVIEKDMSFAESSTCLSVGGLRQQFSLPENVAMSLFGAEFLRDIGRYLAVDGLDVPDVQFQPYGYLFLASQSGAETLQENSMMQCQIGARNVLLSPTKLKERFPWLNVDGIELGCLGLEHEGWFDPWSLLNALRQKNISLGVEYVNADVVGFQFKEQTDIIVPLRDRKYQQLDKVVVKLPNDQLQTIKFAYTVLAAGAQSGNVAKMAGIGEKEGLLSFPLPIEPRKRYVYCYHCPKGPGLDTPLVIDPTGAYFRREGLGGLYIAGISPSPEEEPSIENLDVDYEFFDRRVWPIISQRVPVFEEIKMKNAWAGFYEYNTMDENGVIGCHPYHQNLYIASGFSGHGIQHAPAVGRAIMELMLDGGYKTINLSRLGYDRLCLGEPLYEKNIW